MLPDIGSNHSVPKSRTAPFSQRHKQGKFYIVHFKEMFLLDGKQSDLSEDDIARRNTIANLLHDWELYDLVDEDKTKELTAPMNQVKIISHKEKGDWNLVAKYNIGKRKG